MIPDVAPEAAEWWEATRRRRLLVQSCRACGHRQHYPRAVCMRCGGVDLGWVEASGRGTVYSFTRSRRSPDPAAFEPPYTIAIVTLDEGPRLLTTVTGADIRCDAPVRLRWRPVGDGRHLPVFETDPEENQWTSA